MINSNASLLHYLLKITVGNRIAKIEEHSIQDRVLWEMYALEVNHRPTPFVRDDYVENSAPLLPSPKGQNFFATEPLPNGGWGENPVACDLRDGGSA